VLTVPDGVKLPDDVVLPVVVVEPLVVLPEVVVLVVLELVLTAGELLSLLPQPVKTATEPKSAVDAIMLISLLFINFPLFNLLLFLSIAFY
jgi:hypothetical protein